MIKGNLQQIFWSYSGFLKSGLLERLQAIITQASKIGFLFLDPGLTW